MSRKWARLLNPADLGLPDWVETVRPLSHLADRCVTFAPSGWPGQPFVHVVSKGEFFGLLECGEFEGLTVTVSGSARIADGAVIGKAPFKVHEGRIVRHRGSVIVGENVSIGANTCVDSGIYGECTEIRDGAQLDNLIHVGHSAIVGEGAIIVAGTILGGWSEIGAGAWLGMGVKVLPHVRVGCKSFVGAGSVVDKDVPAHCLVYGVPARIRGGSCCQKPLTFEGTLALCPECGTEFGMRDGVIVRLE